MNLRKKAQKKISHEFQIFKRKIWYRMPLHEIWESSRQICFYSMVREYFEVNAEIPRVYMELVMVLDKPISTMWETYLTESGLCYQTWEDIGEILESILMKWKLPVAV